MAAPAWAQGSGPVAYWNLDEGSGTTAADATGGGADGSLVNGPAWSTDLPPVTFADPASLGFDGTDDCVDVTAASLAAISDTFTLSIWAKPLGTRASTTETNSGINGVGGQRYAVYPTQSGVDGGAGISVGTDGISVFEHGNNYLPSLLVHDMPISGWVHIAVVYVNKRPSLYVGGAFARTGLTSTKVVHPSGNLGGINGGGNYGPYSGFLDDYRIYDRALTPAEIASLAAGASGFDATAPGAAVMSVTGSSHSSVTVAWSAPEDDAGLPASGSAAHYDLRYSSAGPIDDQTKFDAATPFGVPFTPGAPGAPQSVVVTGLTPLTTYYFCLRSADDIPNWSALSNSPGGSTPADSPPAATVLGVVEVTAASVTLGWAAPGDDGLSGTAAAYDLRISTSGPINSDPKFLAAAQVAGLPAPAVAGTFQTVVVTGLKRYTTYHFALKTRDALPSSSPLSNSLAAMTSSGGSIGSPAKCLGSAPGPAEGGFFLLLLALAGAGSICRQHHPGNSAGMAWRSEIR